MESWINAEMGLQAQNFEIPEAGMKICTCSRSREFSWQKYLQKDYSFWWKISMSSYFPTEKLHTQNTHTYNWDLLRSTWLYFKTILF